MTKWILAIALGVCVPGDAGAGNPPDDAKVVCENGQCQVVRTRTRTRRVVVDFQPRIAVVNLEPKAKEDCPEGVCENPGPIRRVMTLPKRTVRYYQTNKPVRTVVRSRPVRTFFGRVFGRCR